MQDDKVDHRPEQMSAAPAAPRPRRGLLRWLARHLGLALASAVVLAVLVAGVAFLSLTGRSISAPDWLVARVETRINAALQGQGRATLGDVVLSVDPQLVPRVRLREVQLVSPTGKSLALLPDVRVTLDAGALLGGRVQPVRLRVAGAQFAVHRRPDGAFDVGLAQGTTAVAGQTLAGLIDALDAIFALPALSGLETAELTGLRLTLRDDRAGRTWQVADGGLIFSQAGGNLALGLQFDLAGGGGAAPARAELDITADKGSPRAALSARVSGVQAADLASQVPALAFLSALDAPLSGTLEGSVDQQGALGPVRGTLDIAAGALRPAPDLRPVGFTRGRLSFDYEPGPQRLNLTELAVDGPTLRVRADGQAYLRDVRDGLPQTLLAQVRLADVRVDPAGVFAQPVALDRGSVDLRLRMNPFAIDVGQLVILDGNRRIAGKGHARVTPQGWDAAMDVSVDAIAHDRLLALWPVTLVPKTRDWLVQNVHEGELANVRGAFRLRGGSQVRATLGYEFKEGDVRFLRSMPPITRGTGYAAIDDLAYTMVLTQGSITAPAGGIIDAAGSVFSVADITRKPPTAEVRLRTDSTITAALSLLDQPPLSVMSKAARPVDLARGRARLDTRLRFLLKKKIAPAEVQFEVSGTLGEVASDAVVPGRPLRAAALRVTADNAAIEIAGAGTLSGVPFEATWRQGLTPADRGKSRVAGQVTLSPATLDAFGIALPEGAVSGSAPAAFTLSLAGGAAPDLALDSDLRGIGLRLTGSSWSKPAATAAEFALRAHLARPAEVETLSLRAPGLVAEGTLRAAPDGGLDQADFATFRLDDWLDASVRLTGNGRGRPVTLALTGGRLDMPRMPKGGGGGSAVAVTLDQVTVSDGIALTSFRGRFAPGDGGLKGTFSARVNGEVPVAGTLAPANGGTAIRVTSEDAGGVFRAAGIFSKGRGGALDLVLAPTAEPGSYDGRLTADGLRVKKAPVLADLLGAISVIGLIEQLNGDGILFSDVQGEFRLTPDRLQVSRGSAFGASMGVSLAGDYGLRSRQMDFRGVVSPIYLVNGIGAIFSRRGEGLFGFNYRLSGPADAPRVGVNPLSVLTPGMFREIFRGPPPKIER